MRSDEKMMVNELTLWVTDQGAGDRYSSLEKVYHLENHIGAPKIGETRLSHLYKWVRLDREESLIRKEKELYRWRNSGDKEKILKKEKELYRG